MYKYKQTTDVEVGDLVVWTDISKYHGTLTKDKVYQVTNHPDQNTLNVINDKGNKNSYGKGFGFKVLQTKPASEAVVGDYMYRITSGSDSFPQHTIIKITKITPNYLYYKAGQSVLHDEVIVIAEAEQTSEYPVFKEDKVFGFIFKYTGPNEGIYLTNKGIPRRKPGDYSPSMIPRHSDCWKPCDFTIQPDIDDIDWWQARFEAGLPVYVKDGSGDVYKCNLTTPKSWDKDCTFSMTDPSLAQQAPTIPKSAISFALYPSGAPSEPTQTTTKEQPMDHTIQLTAEQFEALQSGKPITIEPPKPTITKWEPKGGKYAISFSNNLNKAGMEYQTRSQADSATKQLRAYARQLAWLAENDDGWVADWSKDQNKYYVTFSHEKAEFEATFCYQANHLSTIYMSKDNAIKLAQLMNDDVVEF